MTRMPKLSIDIEMADVSATNTTNDITYGTFTDDEIRSPRTPTYLPTPPNSSKVAEFDPSRIFSSQKPALNTFSLVPPEPARPLAWIWQCHLCKSRYPLSATRRCLQDGHFYCSGEADRPNLKKKKRGLSCSSEFDYIGWREWGEWKRKVLVSLENGVKTKHCAKGCEKCEFPSQCRYAMSRALAESTAVDPKGIDALVDIYVTKESKLSSSTAQSKNSRFYSAGTATFDSILGTTTTVQNEHLSTKMGDSMGDAERDSSKDSPAKSTSVILDRVVKSAEKRSGKKPSLSPIAEEFSSSPKMELTGSVLDGTVLNPWSNTVRSDISKNDEDVMDLS